VSATTAVGSINREVDTFGSALGRATIALHDALTLDAILAARADLTAHSAVCGIDCEVDALVEALGRIADTCQAARPD